MLRCYIWLSLCFTCFCLLFLSGIVSPSYSNSYSNLPLLPSKCLLYTRNNKCDSICKNLTCDAFLETHIFAPASFIYLKLYSVVISVLYSKTFPQVTRLDNKKYRKWGKICWAKLSWFFWFLRVPRKFSHEYLTIVE